MSDDQVGCEWVSVSSGTSLPGLCVCVCVCVSWTVNKRSLWLFGQKGRNVRWPRRRLGALLIKLKS